ncbi:histidyl-tRNA synthetase [Williamsoniiplasma somnilux]|uniref:Histidine--tRNA ligase n=1 Tax=Williamsoniiplasma somnilux TaxID=215578 RepID=A0A2K8NY81_9MOLU|nr:histidine--tRNA ligase [Williamsoniiplasma somnilux]ATZ18779.1 histidyl-tRNA synthetase [Williamsoniiplasma somnilux]
MIQKPRGTQDLFLNEINEIIELETILKTIAKNYNFQEIRTPIFEAKELFVRSVGTTSDVVSKEMYEFVDKKNRQFVLRPEGTAPVVRALIENKLYAPEFIPFKTFYIGPMFRYERPQVGRNRQFNQFGVEVFGPNNIEQDLELINFAYAITKKIGIEKNIQIDLNFLVTGIRREKYISDLKKYLETFKNLCNDCTQRLSLNPLRVLDCKIDGIKFLDAPNMQKYLNSEDELYFSKIVQKLKESEINVKISSKLVRGLDYYTGLIFEVKYNSEILGSQDTIIAGGRYNNLVSELGGPNMPAAGFALGIERILIILKNLKKDLKTNKGLDLYTIALSEKGMELNYKVLRTLREQNVIVDTDLMNRSFKSAFKQAEKLDAKWIIIFGDEEFTTQKVTLKNQKNGEQIMVDVKDIFEIIQKNK